jgi:phosphate transport system substrate-binding protein
MKLIIKIILTIITLAISVYFGTFSLLILSIAGIIPFLAFLSGLILPGIALPLIWVWKHRKKILKIWLVCILIYCLALGLPYAIKLYEKSITVNTSPNINTQEYLPFKEDSKIVKIDSEFKLTDPLPVVDGAAAVFPVYSAFVHATYPDSTTLYDGVFEYNNTSVGYSFLAERDIDIFFGAYPSEEQITYAEECGNPFAYTPIGSEAFVFFVHKDNPITNLTTKQIKGIYSGKITNWKEVGGRDEKIVAYQRNEGSGSQSMLKRFMEDTPIMDAPSEQVNDFMSGIIERVSDYRSSTSSIGFSFRFYVEGIIKNPDIKMISIDGIAPTIENIKNGTYPIVTSLYAVTNANEENENVQKLIDWVLSEEGQRIIEDTGYVGVK